MFFKTLAYDYIKNKNKFCDSWLLDLSSWSYLSLNKYKLSETPFSIKARAIGRPYFVLPFMDLLMKTDSKVVSLLRSRIYTAGVIGISESYKAPGYLFRTANNNRSIDVNRSWPENTVLILWHFVKDSNI